MQTDRIIRICRNALLLWAALAVLAISLNIFINPL